ncbi:hypothetical protein HK101_008354 [Irineochytrium annulatum]|nr:hypothetical protein HK101_008354 [Irineochytrium annulatum]
MPFKIDKRYYVNEHPRFTRPLVTSEWALSSWWQSISRALEATRDRVFVDVVLLSMSFESPWIGGGAKDVDTVTKTLFSYPAGEALLAERWQFQLRNDSFCTDLDQDDDDLSIVDDENFSLVDDDDFSLVDDDDKSEIELEEAPAPPRVSRGRGSLRRCGWAVGNSGEGEERD